MATGYIKPTPSSRQGYETINSTESNDIKLNNSLID